MIVHVAAGSEGADRARDNVPTFPHAPALATMPVMTKEPNAGSVSVTWRFCASDGPLFVTVMT